MAPGDEVVHGVLIDQSGDAAYPVSDSIALLLSDADTDVDRHVSLLEDKAEGAPVEFRVAIDSTVERLRRRVHGNEGQWNREEMAYYDRETRTPEGRARVELDYRAKPVWGVFLPRFKHLVEPMRRELDGRWLLEVGCGGARTMSWLTTRDGFSARYVGIDVSWSRLLVAKALMPGGVFIQASALNLPFRDEAFGGILGFGVYHHLPDPLAGIQDSYEKLAPGGLIGFHEPIDTPKLLAADSRLRPLVDPLLVTYVHSEHDNEIPLGSTLRFLKASGATVVTVHYSNSVIRTVLDRVVGALPPQWVGRSAWELTSALDRLAVNTICRMSQRLGPRAVVLLARKEGGRDGPEPCATGGCRRRG
jgi:SAM-dependent methyltransferase